SLKMRVHAVSLLRKSLNKTLEFRALLVEIIALMIRRAYPRLQAVGGRRAFFRKLLHLKKARLQIATLRTLNMELLLKALKTTFKLLLGVVIPAAQFRDFITQERQIVLHHASRASRTLLRLSARTFRFRQSRARARTRSTLAARRLSRSAGASTAASIAS
ncbi:unnamed protein product, partial [Aphanomyces euteiches]